MCMCGERKTDWQRHLDAATYVIVFEFCTILFMYLNIHLCIYIHICVFIYLYLYIYIHTYI